MNPGEMERAEVRVVQLTFIEADILKFDGLCPVETHDLTAVKLGLQEAAFIGIDSRQGASFEFTVDKDAFFELAVDKAALYESTGLEAYRRHRFTGKRQGGKFFLIIRGFREGHEL